MKRDTLFSRLEHNLLIIGKEMHEEQIGHSGCSPAQNHVLMIIGIQGDVGIKQLAEILHVTSGAATQHVDALEKAGLLARETSASDRREVIVRITSKGKDAFQEIRRTKTKMLSKLFGALSDDELHTLVNLIEKVRREYVKSKGSSNEKVQ
jgi:DNA-binding MarR family transcriptional regulator